jgi:hypothetical protein
MDQGFLIAFHHVPEEIEAWLNARAVRATLPRVVTDISKDEDDWFSKCGVSVRVEWDDRFAQLMRCAALHPSRWRLRASSSIFQSRAE